MLFLGIETSCDDTSLALVEDGTRVVGMRTASQIEMHNLTGGVVPELAAREHVNSILPVLRDLCETSGVSLDCIDAIAVTRGPGLVSSLLVGDLVASTLAWLLDIPIIPVHHIGGHIYANWLERLDADIRFPLVILTASGGHNELVYMPRHLTFEHIGRTRDDAAGEAFDKVARILGLGYPGGPLISKSALSGNAVSIDLPRAWLPGTYDFSFSGLKSEVLRVVEKELRQSDSLSGQFVADMAASFQMAVIDVLVAKLFQAAREYNASEVHIAGGVSANVLYRETVERRGQELGFTVKFPVKNVYSTDNGAMIAALGYFLYRDHPQEYTMWRNVLPDPNLKLFESQ